MQRRVGLPEFPVAGGCQCGAVRYDLLASPLGVYNCHCRDCQRFSGAAFAMSMVVRKGDFKPNGGEIAVYRKVAESGRIALMHACAVCGTKLWNEPLSAPDILILKPGTLDDMSWAAPAGNIWVSRKLDWVHVEDDLPAYDGQPASRDEIYDVWNKMTAGAN